MIGFKDKRKQGWFWAYNEIFEKGLSCNSIAVYCLLCKMVGNSGKRVFPSQGRIGELLHISKPTVIKALKELEEKHLIHVERRVDGGQKTNEYWILDTRIVD